MKRNTATQLLRLLSIEEIRKLSKFLRSPYFNYSQPVIYLFEQLRKWHPEYEVTRIRPHVFWKNLYPNKEFSEQKYWTLNFNLRCLIERFMAIEEMEGNETEFKKQLIKSHSRRNAHALFEKETKALVDKLENESFRDIHSYSDAMWLKHGYYYHPKTHRLNKDLTYSINDILSSLDRLFVLYKLRLLTEVESRKKLLGEKLRVEFLDECINRVPTFEVENAVFSAYKYAYFLNGAGDNEKHFISGKELVKMYAGSLPRDAMLILFFTLRNYATRQINSGNLVYWKELFLLNKSCLELDLIVQDDRITDSNYGSIIHTGCFVKEFEWTKRFMNSHQKYLDEKFKKDTVNLGWAIWSFESGQYDKALQHITNFKSGTPNQLTNIKIIELKAWYEKFFKDHSSFELILSKIEAAEKYFRRNKLFSKSKSEPIVNFLLILKMLISAKIKVDKSNADKKKLEKIIALKNVIVSKKWLLEKIELLN